jgi:hypothetical protein
MLTPQLQVLINLLSQGNNLTLEATTGILDIEIDTSIVSDVTFLCHTIKSETLEKIEDFSDEDEKMLQGDIGLLIGDDEMYLYWYSPISSRFPNYFNNNGSYLIKLEGGTLKHFGHALKKMGEYHQSLRENEQFQNDAYTCISEC